MKIKSLHIKNKIEICGIVVITSLFAAALISNLGFSSTDVLAQGSQNATQHQQDTNERTEIHTKPKNVSTRVGVEHNIILGGNT
jgi:hypothetical protein